VKGVKMSTNTVHKGSVPVPSTPQQEEFDLFSMTESHSYHAGKTALWNGILVGLCLLLSAYWTNAYIGDFELIAKLMPTWYDWARTGVAAIGIVGSAVVMTYHLSRYKCRPVALLSISFVEGFEGGRP